MQKKTKFTAVDIENNLFDLATKVTNKNGDARKTGAAVSAYSQILRLQALKIKAHQIGLKNNEATDTKKSLQIA